MKIKEGSGNSWNTNSKNVIAILLTVSSMLVLLLITINTLFVRYESELSLNFLGQALLPLIGTWMGTILAFYFAKENFDAAARQYNKVLDRLTPEQKLSSLYVKDIMKPVSQILSFNYDEYLDKSIMSDIISRKDGTEPIMRFLFFKDKTCKYIIHRSVFDSYLLSEILTNGKDTDFKSDNIKLKDLLRTKDAQLRRYLDNGIVFVKESATLLEAKQLFDSNPDSQDVIVTLRGNKDEDVLGWLTNLQISDYSRA